VTPLTLHPGLVQYPGADGEAVLRPGPASLLPVTLLITIFVLGLLASLSPSTIVVFILLLATTRARVNAAAFLIGWTLSLIVVFAVAYLVGGAHSLRHGGGHTAVAIIEILFGVALAGLGIRRWRARHEPRPAESGLAKTFTSHLQGLRPFEATIVGVLEQPWTLTAAAAVIVVRHHTAVVVAAFAFLLFTIASTATVGLLFLYYSRRPGEAEARLADLRARLVALGPTLFAAVSLLVGAYLVIDGVSELVRT
jgi:Sap, sulfolipid-1-addressing protein